MERIAIVLLGAQASGKGTQAALLSMRLGLPVLAPGALFRKLATDETSRGAQIAEYIDQGELLPLDLSNEILFTELEQERYQAGVIFDGYPRSLAQAKELEPHIAVTAAILIHISDAEAIARITNRRTCSCGAVYNLITNPPRIDGICDVCGNPLQVRADDQPEAIVRRLRIFHEQTHEVLEYYYQRGTLIEVDGTQTIEAVFADIVRGMESKRRIDVCTAPDIHDCL